MNASVVKEVIHLRFHKLRQYYKRMEGGMGIEDIHHFRVEIKKLRAFLRMIQADDSKIKIPASLKDVGGRASKIAPQPY